MFLLFSAIACSVAVSILLKVARGQHLQIAQSILINYAVASALTWWLLTPDLQLLRQPSIHWLLLTLLGFLLPSVFLLMAKAVARSGIALSDAAQRLSLLIPLLMAFLLFAEPLSAGKLTGISLALIALLCLVLRPNIGSQTNDRYNHWLLLGVWLGYGIIDVTFKQLAKTGAQFPSSLFAGFVLAGLLLGFWLFARNTRWHLPSLAAGLLLGLLNFGNIYAYIRAHQSFPDNPSLVFAAMNIGVICLGTLVGVIMFKEKLLRRQQAGLLLAVMAIGVLVYA